MIRNVYIYIIFFDGEGDLSVRELFFGKMSQNFCFLMY